MKEVKLELTPEEIGVVGIITEDRIRDLKLRYINCRDPIIRNALKADIARTQALMIKIERAYEEADER